MTVKRFEDLEVWIHAKELVSEIYALSNLSKFSKDFSLKDQIRRSAVSVMSNIAEGFERDGNKEFIQFLAIAKGSSGETRSLLYIAVDQEYIPNEKGKELLEKYLRLAGKINNFIEYLKKSKYRGKNTREVSFRGSKFQGLQGLIRECFLFPPLPTPETTGTPGTLKPNEN